MSAAVSGGNQWFNGEDAGPGINSAAYSPWKDPRRKRANTTYGPDRWSIRPFQGRKQAGGNAPAISRQQRLRTEGSGDNKTVAASIFTQQGFLNRFGIVHAWQVLPG